MTGIALAAAALFSSAGVGTAVAAEEAKVQCHGLNSCKGKGECKSAKNDCKGQNACKGQGFVTMSEKECKDKGGKPEAIKS
jgi:uncharacterized membrane protein